MRLVHQPVLPHHSLAICWAPPYHRAFAPATPSTWLHLAALKFHPLRKAFPGSPGPGLVLY